jgi:hypothetical protein
MLTIEEQIERIADHAFERASAPVQPPRRWPALAAAAVVLLTAGSVVWMVSDRDPADIAVAPSDTPSLSARLEGAEEYPLTATTVAPESDDVPMLAIEEPDTLTAARTVDGTTVFRVSGLATAPGTKVYEAVCAGVPGRSVGCEGPSLVDLPWVLGTPFLNESEQLSIWGDVPSETAAVLITDGATTRWQRPVDGLAVWPRPTTDDWTVEAIDANGTTIIAVDQRTQEQLQSAAAEAFDGADTRDSDTAVIQQVRDCLTRAGATFDSSGTRPLFSDGVDTKRIWDDCVTSGFEERSTTAATPASDAGQVALPTSLPGDWRVFGVSRTSSIVQPSADQVFGRSEQNGVTGLRVVVTSLEFLGVGEGAEQIDLRGQPAGIVRDAEGWHVQWGEAGVRVEVTSRGLDRELFLAALEQLEFRAEPITGFDPTSAPADLPLLIEAVTDETTPQIMTGLRLKQGDALPTPAEATGADPFSGIATIWISDRSGLFGSAPHIVFHGERRGDLVVDQEGENPLAAVLADGTIVVIRLPEGVGSEVADAILDGLAPRPASAFVALQDETSARLAQLPEVRVAAIDDRHTLRLRGDAADAPLAMCLDVDGVERCRLTLLASPIGDPASINSVVIAGRWYVFGFEPADQDPLTIAPWRDGETLDPLPSTDAIADGVRSWFTEIPTDVDDIWILDLPTAQGQQTTFRRPDR